MTDNKGFNLTNKATISYANLSSVAKPEKIAVVNETISTEYVNVDHSREEEEMQIDEISEEEYETAANCFSRMLSQREEHQIEFFIIKNFLLEN